VSSATAANRAAAPPLARRVLTAALAVVVGSLALLMHGGLLQGIAISLLGVGSGAAATVPGVLVAATVAHLPVGAAVLAAYRVGGPLGRRVLAGAAAELGTAFGLALWVWPY
jgi:hypothetical protein